MPLTAAQIRDHVARMLQWGFAHLTDEQKPEAERCYGMLVQFGKEYRLNETTGTLEDRTEAMREARLQILESLYGIARTAPNQLHFYQKHIIAQASPGEDSV